MEWLTAACWGAFGGFAMEALDFIRAVRWHRKWPWLIESASLDLGQPQAHRHVRPGEENLPATGFGAYLASGVFRIVVSGGLAGAIAASAPPGTVTPWVSLISGVGSLAILERLLTLVPLLVRYGKDAVVGMVEAHQAQQAQQQSQTLPPAGPAVPGPMNPGTPSTGSAGIASPAQPDPGPGGVVQ
ncbi:hypothetical protein [Streptomyces himalayensis]|uniref:Uncharacterized protein n=1 Tax=Streptomyces himalayensis subsp. himalayensis TaxID=2756131 RepID=A0A7W0DR02_9ACTN|nr:hypothetical protein [Streptomyces himalayensis]MBA2949591.1 hypothetical protein [Streptomyces himalayensis subsp. himalayensis]